MDELVAGMSGVFDENSSEMLERAWESVLNRYNQMLKARGW